MRGLVGQTPNGGTLLKRSHLQQSGCGILIHRAWHTIIRRPEAVSDNCLFCSCRVLLVSIPYWEWDAVENEGPAVQREYLAGKLQAATNGEWEGN